MPVINIHHEEETCSFFPGKTKIVHHGFDDPPELAKNAESEEDALVFYRQVRDKIKRFIEELPDSIERGNS